MDFYCEPCKSWTPAADGGSSDGHEVVCCYYCGEMFQCGECGGWITADGTCTTTLRFNKPCTDNND